MLGIPWEPSKDMPFSCTVTYLGFTWELDNQTVILSDSKCTKYIQAIEDWHSSRMHPLADVQKLYGRLLHATRVIPAGRAYLTSLEATLAIFGDTPFKPRTPPHHSLDDLSWWHQVLSRPPCPLPIPGPTPIHNFNAFSDTSSGVGIGITLGTHWKAWTLRPGWKSDNRDIGWVESISFELLILHILSDGASNLHFQVFTDNRGVVEGWWNRHSRNRPTNNTFKRIHSALEKANCTAHTKYIPSGDNPADGPSHGIYPPAHLMLPTLPTPPTLCPFISDVTEKAILSHPASLTPIQKLFPLCSSSPPHRDIKCQQFNPSNL